MVSIQHLDETMFSASHKESLMDFLKYLLNLVLRWYSTKGLLLKLSLQF